MTTRRIVHLAALLFLFAAAVLAPPIAQAAEQGLCYATGFERPIFKPGQLHGQDEWKEDGPNAASILPVNPQDGKQAIRVLGSKLTPSSFTDDLVETGLQRLFNYDAIGQMVDISVQVQLEGPSTATGGDPQPSDVDLISANLSARIGEGASESSIPSLILSSSGDVWVVSGPFYLTGTSVTLNEYYKLGIRIDFDTRNIQYFVDDQEVLMIDIPQEIETNFFARAPLFMVAVNDRKLVKPNKYKAYFDNYCVATTDSCETQCLP